MLTPLTPADGDTILPLADARVHLNLTADDSFHDTAVLALRDAAINWVENYSGRSLQSRQFEWTADRFTSAMRLPIGPATAVDEISYYDGDGTDTALTSDDWRLGNSVVMAAFGTSWPYAGSAPDAVRIKFTAGYLTADDIPPMLLAAVKLAMTAIFEDRANPNLSGAMMCADQFRTPLL